MADRPQAQLITLRAFLMLAVIAVAIATFTAIVSVWLGALEDFSQAQAR